MLNWLLAMFLLSIFYWQDSSFLEQAKNAKRAGALFVLGEMDGRIEECRRSSCAAAPTFSSCGQVLASKGGGGGGGLPPSVGGALASQKVATTPLLSDPAIVVGPRSYPILPVFSMEVAMDSHNVKWTEEKLFRVAGWLPP